MAHPATDHVVQFFESKPPGETTDRVRSLFKAVADRLVENLPDSPEKTVALRALLEAKEAAVRASLL
jgi:hypothetical protein